MKVVNPIILLISSCVLIACGGGSENTGGSSNSGTPGVDEGPVDALFIQTSENTRNDPSKWFEAAEVLAATGQEEIVYLEQLGTLLNDFVDFKRLLTLSSTLTVNDVAC